MGIEIIADLPSSWAEFPFIVADRFSTEKVGTITLVSMLGLRELATVRAEEPCAGAFILPSGTIVLAVHRDNSGRRSEQLVAQYFPNYQRDPLIEFLWNVTHGVPR